MRPTSILRALRATLGLLALLGVLLTPAAVGAASAAASATATPDLVEVSAWGFQGGELVAAWLTGPQEQVIAHEVYYRTDGQGATRFELTLGADLEAGRWTITIYGLDSQQAAYTEIDKLAADDAAGEADDGETDDDDDDEDSDTDGDGDEDDDSD
jgi:hypothetical protein